MESVYREVPTEALYVPPKVENFCWRIEQAHLGDIFGISMRVSNRWGRLQSVARPLGRSPGLRQPSAVILIDEAQEMTPMVLSELRLLASARFDSQSLLCVVLAGDARLLEKLRREERNC